jgi:hypothetical protein
MEMIGAGQVMTRADGADGVFTRADRVFTGADRGFTGADRGFTGPDGVLTGPDGIMARPDGVEIRGVHNISAEEHGKLLADVAAYKARISFLESKLVELRFIEDASNDDSIVLVEELFEDRVVEQLENQAEDQAPMPTFPSHH